MISTLFVSIVSGSSLVWGQQGAPLPLDPALSDEAVEIESAATEPQTPGSLERAAELEVEGRLDEAEQIYRELLAEDPRRLDSRFRLGRLYLKMERYPEAIEALGQVVAEREDASPARLREAAELLDEAYRHRTRELIEGLDSEQPEPDAMLGFGRDLVRKRRPEDAIALLESLVQHVPDDPQAHYWLAKAYLMSRRFEDGLAQFEQTLELAPGNFAVMLEMGKANMLAGRPGAAARIFREVAEGADNEAMAQQARRELELVQNRELLEQIAGRHESEGRLERAAQVYRQIVEQDPSDIEAWFRLGSLSLRLDRPADAIGAFERVVSAAGQAEEAPARAGEAAALLDQAYDRRLEQLLAALDGDQPDRAAALEFSKQLVRKRRPDDAVRLLESLRERDPDDPQVQYWLAKSYLMGEQFETGLEHFERSLELAPGNVSLMIELGNAYQLAGRWGEAETTLREAVELAEGSAIETEARDQLARLRVQRLIDAEQWQDAARILGPLLQRHPRDPRLFTSMALVLERLGEDAALDRLLVTMVERFPNDIGMLMRSAASFQRRGRQQQAISLYARIFELQPAGEAARIALDRLGMSRGVELLQQDLTGEALAIFERLLRIAPEAPRVNLNAGFAYYRLERYQQAEAAYRKALEVAPGLFSAWMQLGALYEETGRVDEAIDAYEQGSEVARIRRQRQFVRSRLGALYRQEVVRLVEALQQGEAGPGEALTTSRELFRKGFYPGVVELLGAALEIAPEEPQLYFWYGRALLRTDQTEPGIAALEQSAELSPGNLALRAELARAYQQAERWEQAERTYQEILEQASEPGMRQRIDFNRRLTRARRLELEGDFEAARAEYRELIARSPQDRRRQLVLREAFVLMELERFDEADEILDRLLSLAPNNVAFRLQLAERYREHDRPERVEEMLQAVLEIAPNQHQIRARLGRFYLEGGRYEEGLAQYAVIFDAAAAADQAAPPAQLEQLVARVSSHAVEVARGLFDEQEYDDAELILGRLTELRPDFPGGFFWLSRVYDAQDRPVEEAGALERAVELLDEDILMRRRLGLAYVDAGMLDEALTTVSAVLEEFPFDGQLRLALAGIHQQRGDEALARDEFVRVLELNPPEEQRVRALEGLGLARLRADLEAGNGERALATAEEIEALVPDDPLVNYHLARAFHLVGRYDDAEATYLRVLELDPGDPDTRLGLARLYADLDREDEAVEIYHELAEQEPPLVQSADARGELDELLLDRARRELAAVADQEDPQAVAAALLPAGVEIFELGAVDAAGEIFEELVSTLPDHAEAHYWLGRVYAEQDNLADSLAVMKRSVELEPGNPRFLQGLGQVYAAEQLLDQAEQAYQQALAEAPGDVELHAELGDLLRRSGEPERATEQYLEAFALAEETAAVERALRGLGLPESAQDLDGSQSESALQVLAPLEPGAPRSAAANSYLAVVYFQARRFADAEIAWRAVLAGDENQPEARLGLARVLLETGRIEQGRELLQRLADDDAEPEVARAAQARLVELLTDRARDLRQQIGRDATRAEDAVELGRALVQRGGTGPAIDLLEAAVEAAPDNPQLHFWLSRAYRGANRPDQALVSLERSAELSPGNMQLQHELAAAYQSLRRLEDAETVYQRVLAGSDDQSRRDEVRRQLGQVRAMRLALSGQPASALQIIDGLLGEFPDDVALLADRGQLLTRMGRLDDADQTFARILEIAPDNHAVRLRLAQLYRSRGETGKYVEQLAGVIRTAPDSSEAMQARGLLGYQRGIAMIDEDDPEGAQEIFARMLSVVPDDALTRYQLGRAMYEQRGFAAAEQHLIEAVRLDPDLQEAYTLLGQLYEGLQRRERAISAYERAVDLGASTESGERALVQLSRLYNTRLQELTAAGEDINDVIPDLQRVVDNAPENVAARVLLGRVYLVARRPEPAIEQLREAVRLAPDNGGAYLFLGSAYSSTEQWREAAEAYSYALSLVDDEERAGQLATDIVLAVARQMNAENRPFAAIRHLEALHEAGLGSERTYFPLAVFYRQLGRLDDASRAFREAIRLSPDNLSSRFNLAVIYQRTNDDDLAMIQYQEIIRRGEPGEGIVEEARRRADFLRNRLALFTSTLSYSMTTGESVIAQQDLATTGAVNSTFSSRLNYNLGTNYRPIDPLNLRLDTGFTYIGNHSTESDTFVPRVGVISNLNFANQFYNASFHYSENRELLLDTYQGSTITANLSGGFRFTDLLAPLRIFGVGGDEATVTGVSVLVRAPIRWRQAALEPALANSPLRSRLQDIYRGLYASLPAEAGPAGDDAGTASLLIREAHVRNSTDSVMEIYRQGLRALRAGRLDAALERFGRVLEIVPDDPLTRLGAGIIRHRQQDLDAAEQDYRMVLGIDPDMQLARLRLAELAAETGRIEEAIELLRIVEAGDAVDTVHQIAADLLRTLQSQREDLNGTRNRQARLDELGFQRGLALIDAGDYDDAYEIMERILEEYPEDPLALLNAGVIQQQREEYPEAEAAYQRVLDRDPRVLNARLRLGMLYAETDRVNEAIAALERVAAEGEGLSIRDRALAELDRLESQRLSRLTSEEIESESTIQKTLRGRLFYNDTQLPVSALSETYSYGGGATFSYSSVEYGDWSADYTLGVRDNENPLGTDYAYLWQEFGVTWVTSVPNLWQWFGTSENIPGLSANISLAYELREYLNVDTNALNVLGEAVRRETTTNSITAGLNYRIPDNDQLSFFLSYSYGDSSTNLPVGLVFNPDGVPIAFQSTGLGSFDTNFYTFGLNFRF